VGFDDQGREVLDYIPGAVAVPPFPRWSAEVDLLLSVVNLQRQAHRAAESFEPSEGSTWGGVTPPGRFTGRLVCHNDICVENVVVRDGRAVAFIDWDWARPVDRLWDVAVTARHWIPLRDPVDLDVNWADLDVPGRARRFFDAHELCSDERGTVIDGVLRFLDGGLAFVREQAEAGHAGHLQQWNDGYAAANRRAHTWITGHKNELMTA
jgi:aminoglycoside phosphotransferase (APT) family kinase protein